MAKQKPLNDETYRPVVLAILDGWGLSDETKGNAIANANIPNMRRFMETYPCTALAASGTDVGLEVNQDGNSEAGHLNIGAGRTVLQDIVKISRSINDGSFFRNPAFQRAIKHVRRHDSTLHIMGLMSNSMSAHSNPDHLLALITLVQKIELKKVALHLFTDGRDSPRYEAIALIKKIESAKGDIPIASISGRFFAMERGSRWERIKRVYDMFTLGKGLRAPSAEQAIMQAYNRNESDEFIQPTLIVNEGEKPITMADNDSIIFFNLRSDRARKLTQAITAKEFTKFERLRVLNNLVFVGMTDFGADFNMLAAFRSEDVHETLPMLLKGYRQLYIAETEKYAHITYFFNGGYDRTVGGEDRMVVPSPKVDTYDRKPEMATFEITNVVIDDIANRAHDFYVMNFAAPDMVAHTGHYRAGIRAAEAVDRALGLLERAVIDAKGVMMITADHGNLEEMIDVKTNAVNTEHSTNPVPFILIGTTLPKKSLCGTGKLADIAPTILPFFHVEKPQVMTGEPLILPKYLRRLKDYLSQ